MMIKATALVMKTIALVIKTRAMTMKTTASADDEDDKTLMDGGDGDDSTGDKDNSTCVEDEQQW